MSYNGITISLWSCTKFFNIINRSGVFYKLALYLTFCTSYPNLVLLIILHSNTHSSVEYLFFFFFFHSQKALVTLCQGLQLGCDICGFRPDTSYLRHGVLLGLEFSLPISIIIHTDKTFCPLPSAICEVGYIFNSSSQVAYFLGVHGPTIK